MGFGSRAADGATTMVVINTPNLELALSNFAFCSPGDLRVFSARGSGPALALVGGSIVLSLRAQDSIQDGYIALNALHRRHTKVSTGDTISVSRFTPPDNFKLALLTLELDFSKSKANKTEQIDAVILAQQLRKRFIDQVMTVGQKVSFEFYGTVYIFTVNQALVEGASEEKSSEKRIISEETYIVFEASPNSGIKRMPCSTPAKLISKYTDSS